MNGRQRAFVGRGCYVRDLNVGSVPGDDRRIEVIANGLPLWGGMQLAVDTTLVSALSFTTYLTRGKQKEELGIRNLFLGGEWGLRDPLRGSAWSR